MRTSFPSVRAQRGVTLIEMMVALVLGLLLLGAVLQFYLANKVSYVTQEQNGYVQEGGRFALDFIARDVRMAGLSGCASRRPVGAPFTVINHLNSTNFAYNLMGGVRGYEANNTGPTSPTVNLTATDPANATSGAGWTPALPAPLPTGDNGLDTRVIPGSDVLVVSLTGPATPLVDPFTNGASFKTRTPNDLKQYEVAVVSNCQQAEIFQITNLNDSGATVVGSAASSIVPGNSGPISNTGPTKDFRAGTEIAALRTYVYYVGRGADNRPALFRSALGMAPAGSNYVLVPEEIINGVDSMQVTYGLDTNGDFIVDSYVTAASVVDWTQVRAVRVALLARSPDEFLPTSDTATYTLAGTQVKPFADRRQRRVFQSTIALRNRLL